ncbi:MULTISPECIES: NAD(P)-dependent oxidoreductase [Thalassospira]|mgnify:FL=1|uniref:NAD(P)-dependent oxidoreductase n=1 Tax=Thalassospira TaxID=168934 RepID=UPI0008DDD7CC|nr:MULTISPECIES: NAD(P)-dependent oxidoreductase [Thalassospira]MDM7976554.1 NAD(P)-dependent oxidoreductase [Thalassospira xiamenensis]OHY97453.1 NADPH oxidoreductase [Thalassospira sp. MIT1004]
MPQKIGFLGAGRMASAMISRLLEQGYSVKVWNRSAAKIEPLVAKGAIACATPAEAASDVDAVLSFMADDIASETVWLGENGALGAMTPGALAIECSTLSHGFVLELSGKIMTAGCLYVDAPVTAVPAQVAAGETMFLIGADDAVLKQARPIMEAVANRIVHFGPIGSGTIYKLMNNLLGAVHIAAAAELVAVAQKAGLDGDLVADAFANGAVASRAGVMTIPGMISGNHNEGIHFTTALRAKDAGYAMWLADELGLDLPVGRSATEMFDRAIEAGLGDLAQSAVLETIRGR